MSNDLSESPEPVSQYCGRPEGSANQLQLRQPLSGVVVQRLLNVTLEIGNVVQTAVQHILAQPFCTRFLQSRLPCQYLGAGNATALVRERALVRSHFRLKRAEGHIKMVATQRLKPALGQRRQHLARSFDQLPPRMHSSVSGAVSTMKNNMTTYLCTCKHVLLHVRACSIVVVVCQRAGWDTTPSRV